MARHLITETDFRRLISGQSVRLAGGDEIMLADVGHQAMLEAVCQAYVADVGRHAMLEAICQVHDDATCPDPDARYVPTEDWEP